MSEHDTKAGGVEGEGAEGQGLYEQHLERQAQALRRLKVQRGDPPLRRIQARARELFGDGVPLATQHAAFNGRYVSLDKLIVLVRTLMSWDPYGQSCPAPDRTHPDLAPWHEQWRVIAELRSRRHRPAPIRTSASVTAPAPALAPASVEPVAPDASQDHSPEAEAAAAASPPALETPASTVPTPRPPTPTGPGRFAARVLAKASRTLTGMSLAGVLILALDASSPHLCTAAHAGSTQRPLPAANRPAGYAAHAAGGQQRPAPQAPGMCIHAVGRACPEAFPGPTPTPTLDPTPTPTPPPSLDPYPGPDPSAGAGPDPSPSVSLTSTPEPTRTREQGVCT